MSSPNAPDLTPESNARDIAALTSAVDMLVSQFIRPATQQANANRITLDEVIELLIRHTQGLLSTEQRLDQMVGRLESIEGIVAQNSQQIAAIAQQQQANAQQIAQNSQQIAAIAQQQQANAQQIAQNAEAVTAFDQRLEETRQLVAKNSSDFARMNTDTKANLDRLIEENRTFREESRAFRESQQSQLAAIIGNARRIDRLEQQAG